MMTLWYRVSSIASARTHIDFERSAKRQASGSVFGSDLVVWRIEIHRVRAECRTNEERYCESSRGYFYIAGRMRPGTLSGEQSALSFQYQSIHVKFRSTFRTALTRRTQIITTIETQSALLTFVPAQKQAARVHRYHRE